MAEMFAPLLAGTPLWAPPPGLIKSKGIAGIVGLASIAGVSRLTLLPSQLSALLLMIPDLGTVWPSLRVVIISGEACDSSLASRFHMACETAQLVNIYGSTEVGADVCYAVLSPPLADAHHRLTHSPIHGDNDRQTLNTSESGTLEDRGDMLPVPQGIAATYPLESSEAITEPHKSLPSPRTNWLLGNAPIGYPIDGNELIIARIKNINDRGQDQPDSTVEKSDESLVFELVADGEPGELFVGGPQLAMGYHNRPEDTADRFISRKAIIGIDLKLNTRERSVGGEQKEEQGEKRVQREEEEEEEGEGEGEEGDDCRSSLQGALSSTKRDLTMGPKHSGTLFRTGDIVVRIPKGPQTCTSLYSAGSDVSSSRMEADRQEGGQEGGWKIGGIGMKGNEGSVEGRDNEGMGIVEGIMDSWAGAIVWLGRRDLQVKVRGVRVEIEEVERTIATVFEKEFLRVSECEYNNTEKAVVKSINGSAVSDVTAGIIESVSDKESSHTAIEGEKKHDKDDTIRIREGIAVVGVQNETKTGHHLILFIQEIILNKTNMANSLQAKKFLLHSLESIYVPLIILPIKNIPRTITGKLDRQILTGLAVESVVQDPGVVMPLTSENSILSPERIDVESRTRTKIPYSDLSVTNDDNRIFEIIQEIVTVYLNVLPPSKNLHELLKISGRNDAIEGKTKEEMEGKTKEEMEVEVEVEMERQMEIVKDERKIREVEVEVQNEIPNRMKQEQHQINQFNPSIRDSDNDINILGGHDLDFYSLGGDSMTAVQAIWHLESIITLIKDQSHSKGSDSAHTEQNVMTSAQNNLKPLHLQLSIKDLAEKILMIVSTKGTFSGLNDDESNYIRKRKHTHEESIDQGPRTTHKNGEKDFTDENTQSASLRYSDLPVRNPSYTVDNVEGRSLVKVSVCGRCDKWEWYPRPKGLESGPVKVQDPPIIFAERHSHSDMNDKILSVRADVKCEKITDDIEAVSLQQTGSCSMRKCVDSSPLLVISHYRADLNQSTTPLGHKHHQEEDKDSIKAINHSKKEEEIEEDKKEDKKEEEDTEIEKEEEEEEEKGTEIEEEEEEAKVIEEEEDVDGDSIEVGRLYMGSHGGDFICMDMLTSDIVWTLDLESAFNFHDMKEMTERTIGAGNRRWMKVKKNRVHIEGSATCDLSGNVLYIGCFRGNDVDAVEVEVEDADDGDDDGCDDGNEHSCLTGCIGRVFAIEASSGNILWSTPIAGEIKCSVAVDHYRSLVLVGTYDSSLYVLSQSTGEVLYRMDCEGSIYATPMISTIYYARSKNAGEGIEREAEMPTREASSLVFVATTRGRLSVLSYDPVHMDKSLIVSSTPSSSSLLSCEANNMSNMVLSVVWNYSSCAPIFATPLITSTTVVTETSNYIDAGHRDTRWRRDVIIIGVVDGTIRCLAVISPMVTGAYHGLPGTSCSGEELWKVSFASKPIFSSPCCIHANRIMNTYYQTARNSDHNGAYYDIYEASKGYTSMSNFHATEIFVTEIPNECPDPIQYLPPDDMTMGIVVFGAHDGILRAVSLKGQLLWETDLGSVIFSSPCTVHNSIIVAATTAGTICAVDCRNIISRAVQTDCDSSKQTSQKIENCMTDPIEASFKQSSKDMGKLIPQCGKILASTRLSGEVYSSPVVHDGCVFLGCRDDKVHRIALSTHPHTSL